MLEQFPDETKIAAVPAVLLVFIKLYRMLSKERTSASIDHAEKSVYELLTSQIEDLGKKVAKNEADIAVLMRKHREAQSVAVDIYSAASIGGECPQCKKVMPMARKIISSQNDQPTQPDEK